MNKYSYYDTEVIFAFPFIDMFQENDKNSTFDAKSFPYLSFTFFTSINSRKLQSLKKPSIFYHFDLQKYNVSLLCFNSGHNEGEPSAPAHE